MNLQVLSVGTFLAEELAQYPVPPSWRKATRNMIFSAVSIERALSKVPQLARVNDSRIGLVLGSCSGELETTADFLLTWSRTQMARPVLFQNSLHNATTGFASIHFHLTGPTFSVSALENTPAECVELANTLITEGTVDYCLVTVVEGHQSLAKMMGNQTVREGACAWLVASTRICQQSGLKPVAQFSESSQRLNTNPDPLTAPLIAIDASGFFELSVRWERSQ